MSTFIEFEPTNDSEKVSVFVRIDNDFAFTVVYREAGVLHTTYYNVQGIPDDYLYEPSPPDTNLVQAQLVKDGAGESLNVKIKMFYNASDDTLEPHEIPRAWVYGQFIDKDHYEPGTLLDTISQTFPLVIWNRLTNTETAPVANSQTAVSFDRLYTRLGSLSERRLLLKNLVRGMIDNPNYLQWLAGGTLSGADDTDVNALLLHLQGFQTLSYYPEMLARAISVDANLNSERKFNLLFGMASLDLGEVMASSATRLLADYVSSTAGNGATNTTDRDQWTFMRIGQAAATSPFAYARSNYNMTAETGGSRLITMNGSSSIGTDWQAWLRS